MYPDEIIRLKEQIQMLHERLEILESSVQMTNLKQLEKLQSDINNIKILLMKKDE